MMEHFNCFPIHKYKEYENLFDSVQNRDCGVKPLVFIGYWVSYWNELYSQLCKEFRS